MSTSRELMESELKMVVVPALRNLGFKGSFPHFRRKTEKGIDLFTFQFDKNSGGFVVEISRCPTEGITTYWGKVIAPTKVTAWDLHPDKRIRIKAKAGAGTDSWFRYEGEQYASCSSQVIQALPQAQEWWAHNE